MTTPDPFFIAGTAIATTTGGDGKPNRKLATLFVAGLVVLVMLFVGGYAYTERQELLRFSYWSHNAQVQITGVDKSVVTFKGIPSGETRVVDTKHESVFFDRHAPEPKVGQTWTVTVIASKLNSKQAGPHNFLVELNPADSSASH
jgi:hypothetical protein